MQPIRMEIRMLNDHDSEEQFVVIALELGVLGIGVERAYGMDVICLAEGIEFSLTLEHDEYQVVGRYDPI